MKSKIQSQEAAEKFIKDFAFTKMTPPEKVAYETWKQKRGIDETEAIREIAAGVYKSVEKTKEGFMAVPEVVNSGWGGYNPILLDDDHTKPVMIVVNREDPMNLKMGEWLVKNMKNAHIRYGEGGHMASIFVLDDIWADFLERTT